MILQEYIDNMRQTGSTGSKMEFNSFIRELNKTVKAAERNYCGGDIKIKKTDYR